MCLRPVPLSYKDSLHRRLTASVPCGKCIECLKDYQNAWKIRLSEEFARYMKGVFVTLTYAPANAHLAFDQDTGELIEYDDLSSVVESRDTRSLSLCHRDVSSWLKRCRTRILRAKGEKKQWWLSFACGEYGPRTLRPHYHLFIINLDVRDFEDYFLQDWKYLFGIVHYSPVVYQPGSKSPQRVANYVSKYCAKGEFENPRVVKGIVEKPKRTMSKGIGRKFAEDMRSRLLGNFKHQAVVSTQSTGPHMDLALSCEDNFHVAFTKRTFLGPVTRCKPCAENRWASSIPSEKYMSLAISPEFLENLYNNLKITYFDYEKNQVFQYKLPRYFRNIILGEKTSLAYQLKEFSEGRADELYRDKLQKILSDHLDWSVMQAGHYLLMQENYQKSLRAEKSRKALNDFYQQSIL